MTGARVRERVPDWVVRKANQIELVDSSPEQLRRRMLHGNIYPPEKVPYALAHFFQTDNLIALRELALRYLADETEEELLEHLRRHSEKRLWETRERILVAVTGAPGTDVLLRRAARLAARAKGELNVLHVIAADAAPGEGQGGFRVVAQILVRDLGADWHEIVEPDPAQAITEFAKEHQITQIVLGSSQTEPVAGADRRRPHRAPGDPQGRRPRDRRARDRPPASSRRDLSRASRAAGGRNR